jgi:hypothetical protein
MVDLGKKSNGWRKPRFPDDFQRSRAQHTFWVTAPFSFLSNHQKTSIPHRKPSKIKDPPLKSANPSIKSW